MSVCMRVCMCAYTDAYRHSYLYKRTSTGTSLREKKGKSILCTRAYIGTYIHT